MVNYSYFAKGNFDNDPEPEIVVNEYSNKGYWLRLIDNDGTLIWEKETTLVGSLVVADMNNDNHLEIYSPSNSSLYDAVGNIIWKTNDFSRHRGATIADVNADGFLDILEYASRNTIIKEGRTGKVLFKSYMADNGASVQRAPIFVDLDNDNQGELVVTGTSGTTVYENNDGLWLNASKNYTYYSQSYGSVNDNLTLTNTQLTKGYGQTSYTASDIKPLNGLADIVVHSIRTYPLNDSWQIEVAVANRSLLQALPSGAIIELYKNDPTLSENKFAEIVLNELPINSGEVFYYYNVDNVEIVGDEIFAVAKMPGSIQECMISNNIASAKTLYAQVTDIDGLTDNEFWSIGALEKPAAPVFTSTPLLTAQVGVEYIYTFEAPDENSDDVVRYYLQSSPYSAKLGLKSGEMRWTPSASQVGRHYVWVFAYDLTNRGATQGFYINVTNPNENQAPVITSTAMTTTYPMANYQYQVVANDPDGGHVSYALTTAPEGMVINALSGNISWQPALTTAGMHEVTIAVKDELGLITNQSYILEIKANTAPAITSSPEQQVVVGSQYTYQVIAEDGDNDTLRYALTSNPTGMIINATTGLLQWTPRAEHLGLNSVTLTVNDGFGDVVNQTFDINVISLQNNKLPVITSTPTYNARINAAYQYQLIATDTDGDTLTYTLTASPTGMTVSPTGLITWAASTTDTQNVSVRVSDGQAYTEQRWSVKVLAEGDVLSANIVVSSQFADEGELMTLQVVTTNAVTNALTPLSVSLTLDGQALVLDENHLIQLIATGIGRHALTAIVTDAEGSVTVNNEFFVRDAALSMSPLIKSVALIKARTETLYHYKIIAVDPDGDPLTYSLVVAPSGMIINHVGLITWQAAKEHIGLHKVIVEVADSNGNATQQVFNITVTAPGKYNRRVCRTAE